MRVNQGKSEGSNFFFGGSAYEQAADGNEGVPLPGVPH